MVSKDVTLSSVYPEHVEGKGMKQTEIGLIPEDWEVKELGDIVKIFSGFSFKSSDSVQIGVRWLKIANVGLNKVEWTEESFLPEKYKNDFPEYLLLENDIVIALTRPLLGKNLKIAELKKSDSPSLLNQRVGKIVTNLNRKFVYYLFQGTRFINDLSNSMLGTDPPNMSVINVYKFKIPLPPLAEQEAIANALSDADAWIEKLEQLIAKKRGIKQGAMQTLLTPKEDWEVKKLGEVLIFGSGRDYKHLQEGEFPVYGTGGLMTMVNEFLYEGDSVGIGRKGTIDKPVYLNGKFWTVDTLFYTHSFSNVLPKYIYYQFLLIPWREYNEASGVPSLNKNTLEQIEIAVPSLSEQDRIATILSDMDAEIEALEQQLDKARHIKQGMMQGLLTGRTRLV